MAGRTTWWAHDAAWHRRERQVLLGAEHGAAGPNVLAVLHSWAQEQRADGLVKGGFTTLAREAFADNGGHAGTIVDFAVQVGALHDLELSDDGRLFTVRVSGWESEQPRAKEAAKKAKQRARPVAGTRRDNEGQEAPVSPDVPKSPPTNTPTTTRPDQTVSGGGAREADHLAGACRSLAAAGFDSLSIEQDRASISLAISERDVPDDVDWDVVGQRIRRKLEDGTIEQGRPVSALRFLLKGRAGLPRVGQASGPFKSTAHPDAGRLADKYGGAA